MEAIRAENLSKRFGQVTALDGLNLAVAPGEVFGLVGPDGAGKSTTMRLLAGIMLPTAGDAWVQDCHIVRQAEELKQYISYMPQRFGLYLDLTVRENIDFYADLFNVPMAVRRERIPELLSFSNMTPFQHRRAGQLSGGMKQKLALACALVHTPRILLLDEPTNGVDPLSRRDFWRILYELQREKVTIFVSTAYLDEAERCTRIGLLHQGRLLDSGTPDEVKRRLPGVLVEVRCSQPRAVLAPLARALQPLSSGLFGDTIHLVMLGEDAAATAATERVLAELGVAGTVQVAAPSLEDVFIAMLTPRKGGRDDGGQ